MAPNLNYDLTDLRYMRPTGSGAELGSLAEAEAAADGDALHSTPLLPLGVSSDGSGECCTI